MFKDAMYIKDLTMLGRDLRKTLIIDNLYESFLNQPDNGILVKSWYGDMEDTELATLLPFLKGLVEDAVPDIREVLKRIMNSTSDVEEDENAEGEDDAEGEGEGEGEEENKKDENKKSPEKEEDTPATNAETPDNNLEIEMNDPEEETDIKDDEEDSPNQLHKEIK